MVTVNHDWLARDAGSIHFRHALVTDGELCRSMAESTVKSSEDDSPSGKGFAIREHQRSVLWDKDKEYWTWQ
jgi:hypothetical protein